jgi:hypothetical protein
MPPHQADAASAPAAIVGPFRGSLASWSARRRASSQLDGSRAAKLAGALQRSDQRGIRSLAPMLDSSTCHFGLTPHPVTTDRRRGPSTAILGCLHACRGSSRFSRRAYRHASNV